MRSRGVIDISKKASLGIIPYIHSGALDAVRPVGGHVMDMKFDLLGCIRDT